ncbi:MAG: DUF72 domain-containing protein [Desulfurococcales archaeon]|nr:DUF72 domain-containing protein [Desulfurococcales archaeon]
MDIYVGTSGWAYFWNPDGLDWYIRFSGLNAVELNASFYRFPYPNQVKSWARKSESSRLRWAVKIHRSITHRRVLGESSFEIMGRFLQRMEPLDPYIDFYLAQLPPRVKPTTHFLQNLERFSDRVDLGWRLAVEFRSLEWFREEWVDRLRGLQITYVSVDSPQTTFLGRSGPYTYLRLHGRSAWYSHLYSTEELHEICERIIRLGGDAAYVFFNNDHGMLQNSREALILLRNIAKA